MEINKYKYGILDFIIINIRISPILTILRLCNKIFAALLPSIMVLVSSNFINSVLAVFTGKAITTQVYIPLFILSLIILYQYIDSIMVSFITTKIKMELKEKVFVSLITKRAQLNYRHIENNDTWEIIKRVFSQPEDKVYNGFDTILRVIDMYIRAISILIILFTQVWWAGLSIIAFSVPLFFLSVRSGKVTYEAFREASKHRRKADYFQELLTNRESVDERTLFSFTDEINKKWYKYYETARKINMKALAKNFVRMKGASLITTLISLLITIVLIISLGNGKITIGMFISLVTASFSLVQLMSWELASTMSQLTQCREYLKDFNDFVNLDTKEGANDLPIRKEQFSMESIEFENVYFKYPGTDRYILKDFSMKLNAKKHYAFVGVNGAGKTTLTKLLAGLYDNFEGVIKINSKNIKEYSYAELKGIFGIIYQDFAKYSITVKDNIALGNIANINEKQILHAVKTAELEPILTKLPNGIDTYLGKIKGNNDLSGGEWQRVAIARLLASKAPVYILDEPTAALDPLSERTIYETFNRISKGKTTIFITHRLGVAKIADEVFVIDDGKVIEIGNHEYLMKKGGVYAQMFENQRSWYT